MNRRSFVSFLGVTFGLAVVAKGKLGAFLRTKRRRFTRLWGDGIHDDTQAFQERIDAAVADGRPGIYYMTRDGLRFERRGEPGVTVFVPAATYSVPGWSIGRLSGKPVTVQGDVLGKTILAGNREGEE